MHPLLVIAAVAITAAVIWKRYGGRLSREFGAQWNRRGIITLGKGSDGKPVVAHCPQRLVARSSDQISWEIRDPQHTGAEVWLKDFKLNGSPRRLFRGEDADRKGRTAISDVLGERLELGLYTYAVFLNNKLADDPEIQIKG